MTSLTKRSYNIFESIFKKLYWCPRCNIPLLGNKCSLCKISTVLKVKITPPGDVRPTLGKDYLSLLSLFKNFLGEKWQNVLPKRNIILLNKIQHIDLADEIIIDGQVIGSRYYDVEKREWKFRPAYPVVYGMIRKRMGHYAIVNLNFLKRRYIIHKKHIIEYNFSENKGEYIAVSNISGNFYALGISERNKRIRVIKVWRNRPFLWFDKNPTWREVIRGNIDSLRKNEEEAIDFIIKTKKKYDLPILVSFSGGKDSLATYLLVKEALGKTRLLFNDTGLEIPETVSYVKEFAENEKVDLVYADAGERFWKAVKVMGPPARDYRWCCKVVKLAPISLVIKKNFPKGALNFIGQRKYESLSRALSPRIWKNRWIPNIIAASPINEWRFIDVWLYILWKKTRINPLYYMGFDRLGCWLCPASQIGEFEDIKKIHPELWNKWEHYLNIFMKEKKWDKEWIYYGLWRWINLPEKIKIYLSKKGLNIERYDGVQRSKKIEIIKGTHKRIKVKVYDPLISFSKERYETYMRTIDEKYANFIGYSDDTYIIDTKAKDTKLYIKNIIRMMNCVGCGLCTVWCPTKAITIIGEKAVIDTRKCISCRNCVNICPISEYIFSNLDLKL